MRDEINSHVKTDMDRTQREFLLRQQMKAIQEELGGEDGESDGLDELENRVAAAKLTTEAAEVASKQMKRLRTMSPQSPETAMVRSYIEWILDVPWMAATPGEEPDLASVRADAGRGPLRPGRRSRSASSSTSRIRKLKQKRRFADDGNRPRHHQGPHPLLLISAHPGSARRPLGKVDQRVPWAASSCACRSAERTTKRRSAGTAAPISARFRGRSSRG